MQIRKVHDAFCCLIQAGNHDEEQEQEAGGMHASKDRGRIEEG